MASTSVVAIVTPATTAVTQPRQLVTAGLRPTMLPSRCCGIHVRASISTKEKAVSVATATVMAVALAVPEVANAAGPGLSPSLKNFLLSIAAGGVVLTVIIGVVIGVSNFDPVKRD